MSDKRISTQSIASLFLGAVILSGCGSAAGQSGKQDLGLSGGTEFSAVRAFEGNCVFIEAPDQPKALPLLAGALVTALAEPAVKVLFSTVKSAVSSAAAPQEKSISAAASFYAGNVAGDAASNSNNPFPRCFQIVSGSFAETKNAYESYEDSKKTELLEAAFPQESLSPPNDPAEGNPFKVELIEERLAENGIWLTGLPDLFLELYIHASPNGEFQTFSVTMISYRSVIGNKRLGLFGGGEARDLAITLQISGPEESTGNAKGEAPSLVLSRLRPGTVQRLDPRVIESKWFRIQPSNDPVARVAEVTVTETRDGNAFLQKVSEVLSGISADDEQQVVDAAVNLIDPAARAQAEQQLREVQLAEQEAFTNSLTSLYSLRSSTDEKKQSIEGFGTGTTDRRNAAIAALGDMLRVNIEAKRLNLPALAYSDSEVQAVQREALGMSQPSPPVTPQ